METKLIVALSIITVMINNFCLFFLQDIFVDGNVNMIVSAIITVIMSWVAMALFKNDLL